MEQRAAIARRAKGRGKVVNGKKKTDPASAPKIDPRSNGHEEAPPPAIIGGLDARRLLVALMALKKGDFSVRLPIEWDGISGKIADTFNEVIDLNDRMAKELDRLSRMVGKEGKITERASVGE